MTTNADYEPAWSTAEKIAFHVMSTDYSFVAFDGATVLSEIFRGGDGGRARRRRGDRITEGEYCIMNNIHERVMSNSYLGWEDIVREPRTPAEKDTRAALKLQIEMTASEKQIYNIFGWETRPKRPRDSPELDIADSTRDEKCLVSQHDHQSQPRPSQRKKYNENDEYVPDGRGAGRSRGKKFMDSERDPPAIIRQVSSAPKPSKSIQRLPENTSISARCPVACNNAENCNSSFRGAISASATSRTGMQQMHDSIRVLNKPSTIKYDPQHMAETSKPLNSDPQAVGTVSTVDTGPCLISTVPASKDSSHHASTVSTLNSGHHHPGTAFALNNNRHHESTASTLHRDHQYAGRGLYRPQHTSLSGVNYGQTLARTTQAYRDGDWSQENVPDDPRAYGVNDGSILARTTRVYRNGEWIEQSVPDVPSPPHLYHPEIGSYGSSNGRTLFRKTWRYIGNGNWSLQDVPDVDQPQRWSVPGQRTPWM